MERLRQRFDTGLLRSASSQHELEFMHANIVSVSPVSGKADLKAFVDLPWSIYDNDPNWVPPLKSEVYGLITPGKNPWFEHGEAQYVLCRRAGEVPGRISAYSVHLALTISLSQSLGTSQGKREEA